MTVYFVELRKKIHVAAINEIEAQNIYAAT
jgi:hypothetical protein